MTFLPLLTGLLGLASVLFVVPLVLAFCRRGERPRRGADLHHGQAKSVPRFGGLALAVAFIVVNLFAGIFGSDHRSSLLFQPGHHASVAWRCSASDSWTILQAAGRSQEASRPGPDRGSRLLLWRGNSIFQSSFHGKHRPSWFRGDSVLTMCSGWSESPTSSILLTASMGLQAASL